MNTKQKPTLTIKEILTTIQDNSLDASREILYKQIGALVEVSGTVQKKIVRHEYLKLLIRPDDAPTDKMFDVFAEFTDTRSAEKIHAAKIRKGSKINLSGCFLVSGTSAVNLNYCRIKEKK